MNKVKKGIVAGLLALSLIVGISVVPFSAHASGEKFYVIQTNACDSTNFGGTVLATDGSANILGYKDYCFPVGNYNEQQYKDAMVAGIVSYANTSVMAGGWGYSGVTSDNVYVSYVNRLSAVGISGAYSDLTGKPTIGKAYEGTTARSGTFPIFKNATVSSGTAVFYLTDDGTSTGNALFPNGMIADSVNLTVSDATASYQMSWAFTNSNKTLTVTANKLTTANILTGILGQTQANSSVIKLSIWGY